MVVCKKRFVCEVFQAFRQTQCVNSELQLNHSNRIETSWSFVPFLVAVLSKDIAYFHNLCLSVKQIPETNLLWLS